MNKNIDTATEKLKSALEQRADGFSVLFVQYARQFAPQEKINEAILLAFKLNALSASSEFDSLKKEAYQLIDRIHDFYLGDPTLEGMIHQREEQLRRASEKLTIAHDVIYQSKGLAKRYPGFEMNGVDLTMKTGEITAVVGENANGKSTLLKMVAGELDPDKGEFSYAFDDSGGRAWDKIKRNISFVPQRLPAWRGDLKNNIHYEAAVNGVTGKANERSTEYIIHRLWLQNHLKKNWRSLSGGYKMRFALAKALVYNPTLLVLDEPLAHLDVKAQAIVLDDLRQLANSDAYPMSIIISSQHLNEIQRIADRLIFINDGKVVFNGPVGEIGEDRNVNTFEFQTDFTLEELKVKLRIPEMNSIEFKNGIFIVTTSMEFTPNDFLQKLVNNNIPVTYFRDISKSAKRFFV